MASIFFCCRPASWHGHYQFGRRDPQSLRRLFGRPPYPRALSLRKQVQQSSCKRCQRLVRAEGLEPPQLSSLEPKSSASTSSATPADSIIVGRDPAGGGLIT